MPQHCYKRHSLSRASLIALSILALSDGPAFSAEKTVSIEDEKIDVGEETRPWALPIEAKPPKGSLQFDDLRGWKVEFDSTRVDARLLLSNEQRLWAPFSAKVLFRPIQQAKDQQPEKNKVTLVPPVPIEIGEAFDSITLWNTALAGKLQEKERGRLFARRAFRYSVSIQTNDGEMREISFSSHERPVADWVGWFPYTIRLPEKIGPGAKLLSITLSHFGGLAFNAVQATDPTIPGGEAAAYQRGDWGMSFLGNITFSLAPRNKVAGRVPTLQDLGIEPRVDMIVPPLADAEIRYENGLAERDGGWEFTYRGADEEIKYFYRPETGSLDDLVRLLEGGRIAKVAANGGWTTEVHGKVLQPLDPSWKRKLLGITREGNTIHTRWQWERPKGSFTTELEIQIVRKSLIVEMKADAGEVDSLSLGSVMGMKSPHLVEVPYLTIRGDRREPTEGPAILSSEEGFTSLFLDWYVSSASSLVGAARLDGGSAMINGGSRYRRKTDGKRNAPFERLVITSSKRFQEVLPAIPNPPNPANEQTKKTLWGLQMDYIWSERDNEYYPKILSGYKLLRAYGLEDLSIRLHLNMYRNYYSRRMAGDAMHATIDPDIGGDEAMKTFVQGMKALGFRVGPYTNYALASPLSFAAWDDDVPALLPDGNWRFGEGTVAELKPSRVLEMQEKWTRRLAEKFGFNISYVDQLTCVPPWYGTDYDHRTEGAGKFATAYRAWAYALREEAQIFKGAVLSEGNMQWMYAGLADSYAQPGLKFAKGPSEAVDYNTLVDFQLLRVHPLSNDSGYGLRVTSAGGEPDERKADALLAAELAYGNIGHLMNGRLGRIEVMQPWLPAILKSYFMIKGVQQEYANEQIDSIRYHRDGKMFTTEEAIRNGAIENNQVALRYQNGLEVYVNRNREGKEWDLEREGVHYQLPPDGYYSEGSGKVKVFSIKDGGMRRDYSRCAEYTYVNGGGEAYDFGEVIAAGHYVIHNRQDSLELIAAPFRNDETVLLRPERFEPKWTSTLVMERLDQTGKVLSQESALIDSEGVVRCSFDAGTFKIRLRNAPTPESMK